MSAEAEGARGAPPAAPAAGPAERRLRERLPDAVLEAREERGEPAILIRPESLRAVAEVLKTDPELDFAFLMDIAAVDRLPATPRFEVVYNFYSLSRKDRVRIKTRLPEEAPVLDSLLPLWKGADWFEREAYDMMGVRFRGHPNLRRLLTHPEFVGHPLRKDYEAGARQPLSRSYDLFDPPESDAAAAIDEAAGAASGERPA